MLTVAEFKAAGGQLLDSHHPEAVLLASLHCMCRCAVSKALRDHDVQRDALLDLLDAAMASHADAIGVGRTALVHAKEGVRRVSETLRYLDSLPA